jgi:hypothetical protein
MAVPSGGTIKYGSLPVASWQTRADHRIIGWPASGCSSFGMEDFMRVPRPAARMMDSDRISAIAHVGRE